MPLAHIAFANIPPDLERELDEFLRLRGLGCCRLGLAKANRPESNADFIQALEEFVESRSGHLEPPPENPNPQCQ